MDPVYYVSCFRVHVCHHRPAGFRRLCRTAPLGRPYGADRRAARLWGTPECRARAHLRDPYTRFRCRADHHGGPAKQHRHRPDDHQLCQQRPGCPGAGAGGHAGCQRRHHPHRSVAVVRSDTAGTHSHSYRRMAVSPLSARAGARSGSRVHRPGVAAAFCINWCRCLPRCRMPPWRGRFSMRWAANP